MSPFTDKKIIVPWDFSKMSEQALTKAIELATSIDQIDVVHVTAYPAAMEPGIIWGIYTEKNIQEKVLESFRKKIPESDYPGLTFSTYFGDPGSEIVSHAKAVNAGLIVVSSHGHTGLTRLFLGSVAERIVRLAPCPVLVLRGDE